MRRSRLILSFLLIVRDPAARFLFSRVLIKTLIVRLRLILVRPVRPVRKYLITLTGLPASVEVAERCIESARRYGEDDNLEIMPAIDKNGARDFFAQRGLTKSYLDLTRRNFPRGKQVDPHAITGCLASHFTLWERCVELGEPIIILEHDAMFRAAIPPLKFRHAITLCVLSTTYAAPCSPSRRVLRMLGKFKGKEIASLWGALPGAAGYAIKPEGARRLIEAAYRGPLLNVDHFVTRQLIDILYYHPHPVLTDKKVSTLVLPWK